MCFVSRNIEQSTYHDVPGSQLYDEPCFRKGKRPLSFDKVWGKIVQVQVSLVAYYVLPVEPVEEFQLFPERNGYGFHFVAKFYNLRGERIESRPLGQSFTIGISATGKIHPV